MKDLLQQAVFNKEGLIPAVVQDSRTREVLTVAYMNEEALRLTVERGETYFWSRSRNELWHKGDTSGNFQKVKKIALDCDSDTVLVEVEPEGPACHTGAYSCFGVEPGLTGVLSGLYTLIEQRKATRPENSYTTYLFNSGLDKILKKIGEESAETIIAAKNEGTKELASEITDLLYHLLVLMVEREVSLRDIVEELSKRAGRPK